MKLEARGHSIMSAEASGQDETRAFVDLGQGPLRDDDLRGLRLTGNDCKAAIPFDKQAQDETTKPQLEPLAIATRRHQRRRRCQPPLRRLDRQHRRHRPAGRLLHHPDGAKVAASWTQLAKTIALTVKPGKRTLDTRKPLAKLGAGTETVTIAIPDGWTASPHPGPDFTVHHLRKGAILGTAAAGYGIYVGDHSSYQFTSMIRPRSPTQLFKTATTWQPGPPTADPPPKPWSSTPSGSATVQPSALPGPGRARRFAEDDRDDPVAGA